MTEEKSCIDSDLGSMLPAYEMGLLPPSDQAEFEKHVGSCAFCRSRLYQMSPFITAIQTEPGAMSPGMTGLPSQKSFEATLVGEKSGSGMVTGQAPVGDPTGDGLSGEGQEATGDLSGDRRDDRRQKSLIDRLCPGGWRTMWTAYAPVTVAAVIAFVLLVQQWQVSKEVVQSGSLARLEAIEYIRIDTRSGGAGGDDAIASARELFESGMDCYTDKRYAEAAVLLAESTRFYNVESGDHASLEQSCRSALYSGISFLMIARGDSALVYLEKAKLSNQPVVDDRACWYQAQAFLLEEQVQSARETLESLKESPGFGERAGEQLMEINESLSHDN